MGNGNSQKKLDETLFNLRLTSKQMVKESQRATKDEKTEKEKAKKCLEKGLIDTARIHAENAIRKKNDSLNYLRFASKMDAVASKIQTATRTEHMTAEFSRMLPQLDQVLQNMNVENVSRTMNQFETMFENLDVATAYIGDSLQTSTAVSAPREEVDGLLSQIASEHNIQVSEELGEVPIGNPSISSVREGEAKSKNMAEVKFAKAVNRERRAALASSALLLTESQGFLEPEAGELTYKMTQEKLKPLLPSYNASLVYDLDLQFGPYTLDYTRNGAHLVIAGRQGHLALLNWKKHKLMTEINVKETVKDVKFLHNELLFAVAQRKGLFIYDHQGIEVHCLGRHIDPKKLEFLPYHFLLVSANDYGYLKYLDVSTGKQVVEHDWGFQSVCDMKQNPWNAVICVGDGRGIVSMWAPNANKPLIRLVAHNGPALGLALDQRGIYMATAGSDNLLKIWDARNLGDSLFEYRTHSPASALTMSQTGLLAVSTGSAVEIYKDWHIEKQRFPYMQHKGKTAVHDLAFVPLEDFLGIGLEAGFSSISVPGSGWANYDSYEANPFQTKHQRQEQEVHMLLEKLRPDTIMLNPHEIGVMDKGSKEEIGQEEKEAKLTKVAEKKKRRREGEKGEEIKQKNSVHDKKTRVKLQEIREEQVKPRVEEVSQVAKDIDVLVTETAQLTSLGSFVTKRKKLKDS